MSHKESKEEQELRKKRNLLHAELKAIRRIVRPESLTSNDGESPDDDDGESIVEELNRRRKERKELKKEEERLKRQKEIERLKKINLFYKDPQALKLWTDIQRARRNQPSPQKPSQKKTPTETSSPKRKKSLKTREEDLRSRRQDKRDNWTRKWTRKRLDAIRKKKGNKSQQVQLKL